MEEIMKLKLEVREKLLQKIKNKLSLESNFSEEILNLSKAFRFLSRMPPHKKGPKGGR